LHDHWDVANHKHLKELQKIAVAIQKTMDEKGDLREILPAATQAVQSVAGKLGVKVNDLQSPEMGGEDVGPEDFDLTGNGPAEKQEPTQGQTPLGSPGTPPGALPAQMPQSNSGPAPSGVPVPQPMM
jgi:hypothetical protein